MSEISAIKPRRPKRRRTLLVMRVLLASFAALCLLATLAFYVATRSWFIRWQLQPELEKRLGGEVIIAEARYQGDGRVIFKDMRLRANGLTGPAAEVARVEEAIVSVQLERLFPFAVRITDIVVDGAVLRVSEDVRHDGKLNWWSLRPQWRSGGDSKKIPPRVHLRRASLEFAKHLDSQYVVSDTRLFTGEMQPMRDDPNRFQFELVESNASSPTPEERIILYGELDAGTNRWKTRIDSLQLNDRIRRMCPSVVQALWSRMDVQGRVRDVEAQWSPDQTFAIALNIENIELTLPVETNLPWARYRGGEIETTATRPRQRFAQGRIAITNTSLQLSNLLGQIGNTDTTEGTVGLPYELSLTIDPLPPPDWEHTDHWMEQVIKNAPFDLRFKIDGFNMMPVDAQTRAAVDLPEVVARILQKFQVSECVLTTSVEVSRAPAVDGASPQTTVNGVTYLRNASGKYQKFPYQIDNVDAYLQFDQEKVTVHYLTGTGSNGGKVRVSGEIKPPGNDSAVSLRLVATGMPIDDRFRDALGEDERKVYDMFFDPAILAGREAAPTSDQVAALQEQIAINSALAEEMRRTADLRDPQLASELQRIETRLERLRRSASAGHFQLGGTINLNLNIEREFGDKQPTYTTGTIEVVEAGAVYEKFPYPLRFGNAILQWEKDRIVVGSTATNAGAPFVTPSGGVGLITGEILLPERDKTKRTRHRIHPSLMFDVRSDAFSPALFDAIERGPSGPNAAKIVRSLDVKGPFDCRGEVTADEQGRIGYNFAITLNECTAELNRDLAQVIKARGELWPPRSELHGITGQVQVSRDRVELLNIHGQLHGDDAATLAVDGVLDFSESQRTQQLVLKAQQFPIGPYVLNAVDAQQHDAAEAQWHKYDPRGRVDAVVNLNNASGDNFDVAINLQPREMNISLDGARLAIAHQDGNINIGQGTMSFDGLLLDLTNADGVGEGQLQLDGMYHFASPASFELTGGFREARIESPWVRYLLSHTANEAFMQQFDAANPVGMFDGEFVLNSSANEGEPIGWQFDLNPKTVGLTWRNKPVLASFNQGGVSLKPGEIQLHDVGGKHAEGEFFISGLISTAHPIEATLQMSSVGQIRSDFVQALLPRAVINALDAIKFNDSISTALDQCTLHIRERVIEGADSQWLARFNGPVRFASAEFEGGLRFYDLAGEAFIDLDHDPARPLRLHIDANAQRAFAMGQRLSDLNAEIMLNEDGTVLLMPQFRAETEGGVITAEASTGIGEKRAFEFRVEMVAVPLQDFQLRESPIAPNATDGNGTTVSGDLFASMTVAGLRGDTSTRTGRGMLRVINGRMANIPLLAQIFQLLQFTTPVSNLNYADAEMFLEGDRLIFNHLLFESTMGNTSLLQLRGEGAMNVETLELDTRFRSRGAVPLVRDVVGGIGDALYAIEVTGPLHEPRARLVPLPSNP